MCGGRVLSRLRRVMRGETEEEVMAKAAEHGREVHGMTDEDFSDENVEKIREHIRTT